MLGLTREGLSFLAALGCGALAIVCVYKLAMNLLTVGAGPTLTAEAGQWTWPADRRKILAQSAALIVGLVLLTAAVYALASLAFGASPHLTDRLSDLWRR